ncbi:MAG: ureidoglycolate lyase [Candidatus Binataceae bacterium]
MVVESPLGEFHKFLTTFPGRLSRIPISKLQSNIAENSMSDIIEVPTLDATPENTSEYGLLIGTEVPNAGLTIPYYKGVVEEGANLPFQSRGGTVMRTARIHHRSSDNIWMERHMHMTQVFLGLGDAPLAMLLGKPNHEKGRQLPDLEDIRAFRFLPGHGIMLHIGTWHDFPLAIDKPVTVLTLNSPEVVEALASQKTADEMDRGDTYKINFEHHTGKVLRVGF